MYIQIYTYIHIYTHIYTHTADLPADCDICVEKGEFHTFVYDGPCFLHPIHIYRKNTEKYVSAKEYVGSIFLFSDFRFVMCIDYII